MNGEYLVMTERGYYIMKLLVVEDEMQLADALTEILKRNMYSVDTAYDGIAGLDNALTGLYDCIILDIMLPGMNGLDVLRNMRAAKIHTPVLLLTARSEVEDKIKGLDIGADDYLTKPFVTGELLARVRALTRRKGEIVNENKMDFNTIICTMKEMIFPGMGALIIAFLVTFIPGLADSENIYDDEK